MSKKDSANSDSHTRHNTANNVDGYNEYLNLFNDKAGIEKTISIESIENLLSNVSDLHNAIGYSYNNLSQGIIFMAITHLYYLRINSNRSIIK